MRPKASRSRPTGPTVEISDARLVEVEGSRVRRALPRPRRRTVGAWCFVDHFGPSLVPAGKPGMDVGPHPHCGLATVTWLFDGRALHRDSTGCVQEIHPGQLNWMTAGHGISHAEEGRVSAHDERVHGVQMWVALPEATRHGPPRFDHHPSLPTVTRGGLDATLLVGRFDGAISPAQADTPLLGLDVRLEPGTHALPIPIAFETAIVVVEGAVEVEGHRITPGQLAYLGQGRDHIEVQAAERARFMFIGGPPLEEPLLMGWNFVVRTADELEAAFASWTADDGRFGQVHGARAARIDAPR